MSLFERNQKILELRLSGMPTREIGKKFNLTHQMICHITGPMGYIIPNRDKAIGLRMAGYKYREISEALAISMAQVQCYIRNIKVNELKRFLRHVDVKSENDCWEWKLSKNNKGYGRKIFKRKHIFAHRLSWQLHNGSIPGGMCVLHHCDNPLCCNPNHLYLGTHKDNARDRSKRERGRWDKLRTV